MDSVAPGELSNAITVAFNGEEESQLPESLRLTCEVQAHIPDVTDAGEWTGGRRGHLRPPPGSGGSGAKAARWR